MFKMEDLFVEDKDLGKLLWLLDGLAVGNPRPVPVRGVTTKRVEGTKQMASTRPLPGESMIANIRHMLWQSPKNEVTSSELKALALQVGASEHTAKSAAFNLLRTGVLEGPTNKAPEGHKGRSWQRTYRILRPRTAEMQHSASHNGG